MTTVFVQFSDPSQTSIAATFGCEQDAKAFPNQGAIDASDARYKTFYDQLPDAVRGYMLAPTSLS